MSLYNEGMRLSVVLALALGLSAEAHAKRVPVERCQPLAPQVLPRDRGPVPLNAKVWQLGAREGAFDYSTRAREAKSFTVQGELFDRNDDHPALRYALHDLEPHQLYWLEGNGLLSVFETTGEVDTKPPAQPAVSGLEMTLEYQPLERMSVDVLQFRAHVSDDTALLQIVVEDRSGVRQTVSTTPHHTNICFPGFRLAPGRATVSVFAIDLAGNRSDAWTHAMDVVDPTSKNPEGHYRCGLGSMTLFLFGPVLLAGILLGILLVLSLRHWRGQHGEGDAVTLLVADHIARAVLRRSSSASVAAAVGFVSAWFLDNPILMLIVGLIACVPLSSFLAAKRVLRELDQDRARAELRDTVLIVRSAAGQARLATSSRLIDEARRSAVPTSVAR